MNKPDSPQSNRPTLRTFYHWLILTIGIGLLVGTTLPSPHSLAWFAALTTGLFVALQIYFPVRLKDSLLSLIHVTVLGASLLYDPITAGWGALGGACVGALALALQNRIFRRPSKLKGDIVFLTGATLISLFGAFLFQDQVKRWLTVPIINRFQYTWLEYLPIVFLFSAIHFSIYLIDVFSYRPETAGLRKRTVGTLLLVELLPLPFVILFVMTYPLAGFGSLLALGAVPLIVSILLHVVGQTRSDLERRLEELSALNQVSLVLRMNLDLENLLSAIQLQISELLSIDNFYVALYDPDRKQLWYPLAVKQGKRRSWAPRLLEDRLTDRVILQRKAIIYNQRMAGNGPGAGLPPSEETPTAWIGIPLISAERVIGCLGLFSTASDAEFTRADLELLTTISGQVSAAIENPLLLKMADRRAAQLENINRLNSLVSASLNPQEVLEQICRSVTQVSEARSSAIFLLDIEERQVLLAYAHNLPEIFKKEYANSPLSGSEQNRMSSVAIPNLVNDLRNSPLETRKLDLFRKIGIQSYGDFPLNTAEGQIGYLAVFFEAPHVFSGEEIELFQTHASQAALAVSNARLHARTDFALSQRANQLAILEAISRALSAAIHSERLFEMIMNYAREFTSSPCASISLYNPGTRTLQLRAYSGYLTDRYTFTVEEGISGRVVRLRRPQNVGDVRLDRDFVDLTGGQTRSQLSVPLIHEDRVLGVLTLESSHHNAYSSNDQSFVSQLATQAAVAVVNAELYRETQRRLREQSTLYLVSSHLAGRLDEAGVSQILLRAINVTLEGATTGVYLWNTESKVFSLQLPQLPPSFASGHPERTRPRQPFPLPTEHLPLTVSEKDLSTLNHDPMDANPLIFCADPELSPALAATCKDCLWVILPMVSNQQRLGMVIAHLPKSTQIQEDQLQLLRAIVSQGALFLQNATLFSDVTQGRDRLTAVLNSVGEGIVMIDHSGQIVLVNESTQTLTTLSPSLLVGCKLSDLSEATLQKLGYDLREATELVDILALGRVPEAPKIALTVSEPLPERYLERSSFPVSGQEGRTVGWLVVIRDVTEQRQIDQAREVITETLVHDLRSPLSAITGALSIIAESMPAQEQTDQITTQAIQVAQRSSDRLVGLVDSLLEISQMQSGDLELNLVAIHLRELVGNVLADFIPKASDYGVIMRNEVPDGLPQAHADYGKIQRVLINLVDNALKYTPSGEQVTVSAARYGTNAIMVKVFDSGPGVPEEFREKIFERFSQVPGQRGRTRGSGLGLTFCRLAVRAHGGRIWVEPRSGGGSVFAFTLPTIESL